MPFKYWPVPYSRKAQLVDDGQTRSYSGPQVRLEDITVISWNAVCGSFPFSLGVA
jgi:hypothetical protein